MKPNTAKILLNKDKDKDKDVFIGPKEFVSHMMMDTNKIQAIPPIEIDL